MSKFHKLGLAGAFAAAALMVGCTPEEEEEQGFPQPANTIVVNFTMDATGRPGFYEDEGIEWKGTLTYDKETRILQAVTNWDGPFAPLYDDGPWTTGGHEPKGAVAGDDKFGIAAFLPKPEAAVEIEYGAQTSAGGWIWDNTNGNGKVTINPTDTEVTAQGQQLAPEGDNDFQLTLNKNSLFAGTTFATPVKVKGQMSDWEEEEAFDDGTHGDAAANDGIFTYTLSANAKRRLKLTSGTEVEFVWMIGGAEYKGGGQARAEGVTARVKKGAADWATLTVSNRTGGDKNTFVAIP